MELLILLRLPWLLLFIHAIVFFTSCCCSTKQSSLSSPAPIAAPPQGNTTDLLALLSFKSLVTDPNGVLDSWNASLHFCLWKGVSCGHHGNSQRVKTLDLESWNLTGSISPSLANLTFLKRLHLPNNHLHKNIPEELGRLSRLQYLNLSLNNLDGEIPLSLIYCKHLRFISLKNNMLQGEIPSEFGSISTLQILTLSINNLTGVIPNTLGNLSSLVILSLYSNNLNGNIPPELGSLPSLKFLYLQRNHLIGAIPIALGNISSLVELRLYLNNLDGNIPFELGSLTALRILYLHQSNLSGPIPSTLGNLSSLIELQLHINSLNGNIPPELGSLSALQVLYLEQNNLTGAIPNALGNLSSLVDLHLFENSLNGNIPPELGSLPALIFLYLHQNNLIGAIPSTLGNLSSLAVLVLSYNNLNGNIPPGLKSREASNWNFLTSLTNCRQLLHLEIDGNELGGILPNAIGNLSKKLERLKLEDNGIHGNIPTTLGNLININVLSMSGNHLAGIIPEGMGKLENLQYLDLSSNELSGELPSSLGNLTHLNQLNLDGNKFNGGIPGSFGGYRYLASLILSHNNLSGTIPNEVVSLFSLTMLLDLSHNSLTGPIPPEVGALTNLEHLDMSENKLFGEIPSSLGQCQVLESLHIQGNYFQGVIPQSLSNLKGIEEIDFSRNNLSGTIPNFLGSLKLKYLNLSFNDFEGEVPIEGVFGNVSAISIVGNDKLCGGSFELHLAVCSHVIYKTKGQSTLLKISVSIIGTVLCLSILLCVLVCYKKKNSRKQSSTTTSLKDQYVKVTYGELFKATDGFSSANLIGTGSFGSVYKGVMDGGQQVVAVKVFNLQNRRSQKSFMAECKILREARHKNLVKVVTACSSIDFKGNDFIALVYKYMPNGSLEKWLHRGFYEQSQLRSLSFIQRLNILIDVAAGLDYLHHGGQKPIIHCDLKPSNILLDNDMCGQVGDFGLARFLSNGVQRSFQNSMSSIEIKGTIGYISPEYGMGNEVSSSGDVYSFGIVLLEMFTGKRPIDDTFKDGMDLHKYVEMAFPERVMNIIDPHLLSNETNGKMNDDIQYFISNEGQTIQDCIVSVFKVGLVCSEELPNQRMEMKNVLEEMISIRNKYFAQLKMHVKKIGE